MYALDIALDSAGERMAVIYYDIGDGLGRTVLRVYDISNRVAHFVSSFDNYSTVTAHVSV